MRTILKAMTGIFWLALIGLGLWQVILIDWRVIPVGATVSLVLWITVWAWRIK